MNIKPVAQEAPMGCGLACAAALANLTYEKMKQYFDNSQIKEYTCGFYNRDIIKALQATGIQTKAYSIKKWGKRKIVSGNIVFVGKSKTYPFGHYLLKTNKGWMNPWINFPYMNPAQAGFQKKIPGEIKWIITTV